VQALNLNVQVSKPNIQVIVLLLSCASHTLPMFKLHVSMISRWTGGVCVSFCTKCFEVNGNHMFHKNQKVFGVILVNCLGEQCPMISVKSIRIVETMTLPITLLDILQVFGTLSLRLSRDSESPRPPPLVQVFMVSSLLGKPGPLVLNRRVLETLGSSVSSLHVSVYLVSGMTTKGRKIAILSFEDAKTILKGEELKIFSKTIFSYARFKGISVAYIPCFLNSKASTKH
ncbi:hypothetical protein M8C21_014377, partial [Ambrosia artemisiifolia]